VSAATPEWDRLTGVSAMVDVLRGQEGIDDDDEIHDLKPLAGDALPEWVRRLGTQEGWRTLHGEAVLTRVAGAHPDGSCAASETLSVFGYTGYAYFDDLVSNAACTLRGLGADQVTSRVLRLPPVKWAVAVRAEGVATLGGRRMWLRQNNYLAGSMQTDAGRLIVHTVMVEDAVRQHRAEDVAILCDAVHEGFFASLNPSGAQNR